MEGGDVVFEEAVGWWGTNGSVQNYGRNQNRNFLKPRPLGEVAAIADGEGYMWRETTGLPYGLVRGNGHAR